MSEPDTNQTDAAPQDESLQDEETTIVRNDAELLHAPQFVPQARIAVPIPPPPQPATQYYQAQPRHPQAPGTNPWKVFSLTLLGVLAIGGILFVLLRSNPAVSNTNTPLLTSDPNSSPVLAATPPTGRDEANVPTVAPTTGANINANVAPVNANVTPSPAGPAANANIPAANANTPGPSVSPGAKPANQNTGQPAGEPGGITPAATPKPGAPEPRMGPGSMPPDPVIKPVVTPPNN